MHQSAFIRVSLRAAAAAAALLFFAAAPLTAERPSLEYQVKASLLFNFLSFVEWPADSFKQHPNELHLCILGEDRFGPTLDVIDGEIVQGKKLKVLLPDMLNRWTFMGCNAVYLGRRRQDDIQELVRQLANRPVLTISDTPQFLQRGGMIQFTVSQNKVRFRVNTAASKESRLVLSSQLLQLAQDVVQK